MRAALLVALLSSACSVPAAPIARAAPPASPPVAPPPAVAPAPEPPPEPPAAAEPPLPSFPAVVARALDSGVRVRVAPQPGSGLCALRLVVHAGAVEARPGVAALTATLVAGGAAAGLPSIDAFARRLESAGGELEVTVAAHRTVFALVVPAERASDAVEAFALMLSRRVLAGSSFETARTLAAAEAEARAHDDAAWVARAIAERDRGGWASGAGAVAATKGELTRVRLAHVGAFYQRAYVAARLELVAAGDVTADAIVAAADVFAALPRGEPPSPTLPLTGGGSRLPRTATRRIYLVDWPGAAPRAFGGVELPIEDGPALAASEVLLERWRALGWSPLAEERSARRLRWIHEGPPDAWPVLPSAAGDAALHARAARRALYAVADAVDGVVPLADAVLRFDELGLDASVPAQHAGALRALSGEAMATLAARARALDLLVVVGDAERERAGLTKLGEVREVDPLNGFSTVMHSP